MSRIEVAPAELEDMARRLGATNMVALRARRALAGAGHGVTGSAELTAALADHADAWEWCLERLHDRLLSASRSLADAASVYGMVDGSVMAGPDRRPWRA